jgi:hypothetical protein
MLSKEKWPAAAPAPEFEESDIEQAEMMRWLLAAENDPSLPLLRARTHTEEVLSAGCVDAVHSVQ